MKNKRIKNKLIYVFVSMLLVIIALIGGQGVTPALADSTPYTSVLTDLQKDEEFMTVDYPDNEKDRSITVISIAESTSGELFVYTYQPCQNTTYLSATQISMSLTDKMVGEIDKPEDLTPEDRPLLYNLTLISCESVFCKYKVNGFTVRDKSIRYYNIVDIYRKWLDGDPETDSDNTIKSVYYKVGKLYKAETVNGVVEYLCKDIDVVEIINPFVNFLSYYRGATWGSIFGLEPDEYTDVHYIAFSTDRKIDTLKEVDVAYTTQSYKIEPFGGGTNYGEKSDRQYITLTGKMDGGSLDGFLAGKYSWKCIQRTADFIKATGLNQDSYAYDNIKNAEFVVTFHTTQYTKKEVYDFGQGHSYEIKGTKVSDVAILRLLFETNGKTYNMGTLMNQMEGGEIPGNSVEPIGFWAYIWRCIVRLFNGTATLVEQIVAVVTLFICLLFLPAVLTVLSLVFPVFGSVMKKILNGLYTVIKYFCMGLWWVICLPFKGIKALINKIRGE